jgi:hypothetical protein
LEELERINGIYFCDEDDTFIDVCEKVLAEDKQLWPAYLKMNATENMNGPLFKKKKGKNIIYPGGSGFKDPFQKGVSRRSLEKFLRSSRTITSLPCMTTLQLHQWLQFVSLR